ncbi:MAG: helix-turn-helix domain-containing protein [Clostridiaceae bacterium]
MEIKNNLRDIRMREYAMEPKDFAELIEVNKKTYYGWESGAAIPSMKEGLRVCKKLNKRLEEIWYLE